MRAFTLIETIIYIALFSILMTGTLLALYGMFGSTTSFKVATDTEAEGLFMTRKLAWVLGDLAAITTPTNGGCNSNLSITKGDGTKIDMRLTDDAIELRRGGSAGVYTPLTSDAVTVSRLCFGYLSAPAPGIEACTTIYGFDFYYRG